MNLIVPFDRSTRVSECNKDARMDQTKYQVVERHSTGNFHPSTTEQWGLSNGEGEGSKQVSSFSTVVASAIILKAEGICFAPRCSNAIKPCKADSQFNLLSADARSPLNDLCLLSCSWSESLHQPPQMATVYIAWLSEWIPRQLGQYLGSNATPFLGTVF